MIIWENELLSGEFCLIFCDPKRSLTARFCHRVTRFPPFILTAPTSAFQDLVTLPLTQPTTVGSLDSSFSEFVYSDSSTLLGLSSNKPILTVPTAQLSSHPGRSQDRGWEPAPSQQARGKKAKLIMRQFLFVDVSRRRR